VGLHSVVALLGGGDLPPASGMVRIVIRVLLGLLVLVLLSYIVIEQVGTWRRRRTGRD
jgi:hypothetical protein